MIVGGVTFTVIGHYAPGTGRVAESGLALGGKRALLGIGGTVEQGDGSSPARVEELLLEFP
jgi:hypothetical protein